MDPSDTFENFDMTTFDDFLQRESFEEEGGASYTHSAGSSFSDSFDQMPVYRSLDVMPEEDFSQLQSLSGIDKVFEVPVLSRQPRSGSVQHSAAPIDLFAQLDADLAHTSVPSQSDLLGGKASVTSVVVVASGLEELSATVMAFLQARDVHHEHCASSGLWKCELTDFVDSCKFHIQVYCDEDSSSLEGCVEYTVEFLRVAGCALLFSSQFQSFKAQQQEKEVEQKAERCDVSCLAPLDLTQAQGALESLVGWVSSDQAAAVGAISGLFSGQSAASLTTGGQLNEEGLAVMTLLGTLCMQFMEAEASTVSCPSRAGSALPMLSLLRLLLQLRGQNDLHSTTHAVLTALVDSLVPATARLTASSHASACVRKAAVEIMEQL
mmetsp:Transcript_12762/g.20782  ORF Transcript_12762/g.20782 Transcript_12762/m.20782 type:complete len:380 (-) Transcript_12762:2916-4055(-)